MQITDSLKRLIILMSKTLMKPIKKKKREKAEKTNTKKGESITLYPSADIKNTKRRL